MYCTPEDVRGELYIPLSTQMAAKFSGPGEFDAFLEGHIKAASNFTDAVLSKAFRVPLIPPISPVISTATAKEAAYYAVAQFSENETLLRDRHDTAVTILNSLVDAKQMPGEHAHKYRPLGGSEPRIFTYEMMSDW